MKYKVGSSSNSKSILLLHGLIPISRGGKFLLREDKLSNEYHYHANVIHFQLFDKDNIAIIFNIQGDFLSHKKGAH